MGIMSYIKAKKEEFYQEQHTKRAERLQSLRDERIKLEGREKVRNLERKEKDKIKKLKSSQFESTGLGKIVSRAKSEIKEAKKKSKKKKKSVSVGSGFGQGINPAFSLGKK